MTDNSTNELTQAEFAKLRGVTPPLITRWKQAGRIVMSPDGSRVLVAESMELLDSTMDPARGGARHPGNRQVVRDFYTPDDAHKAPRSGRGDAYHAAARDEKAERAALLRLDRLEREGELVARAQVEAEAQSLTTQARESMMAIPDRLAAQLAAESNVDKVRALLDGEIRHVIAQLSIYAQAQVAA